jgi:hypothetical protein
MLHGQEHSLVRTGTRHKVAWLIEVAMWEVEWSGNNSNEVVLILCHLRLLPIVLKCFPHKMRLRKTPSGKIAD